MDWAAAAKFAFGASLAVLVFGSGLGARFSGVAALLRRPGTSGAFPARGAGDCPGTGRRTGASRSHVVQRRGSDSAELGSLTTLDVAEPPRPAPISILLTSVHASKIQ